jgi:hypothetical protein
MAGVGASQDRHPDARRRLQVSTQAWNVRCTAAACSSPRGFRADRKSCAAIRRRVFHDPLTERNRVWQTDFAEFETPRDENLAHLRRR